MNFFNKCTFIVTISILLIISLPSNVKTTAWRIVGETGETSELVLTEELSNTNMDSIMITILNPNGISVEESVVPIGQFIGGGIGSTLMYNGELYNYDVKYKDNNTVEISMSDGSNWLRIWVK